MIVGYSAIITVAEQVPWHSAGKEVPWRNAQKIQLQRDAMAARWGDMGMWQYQGAMRPWGGLKG